MKYYQEIIESLFYYFKKSPGRCDKMEAVQKVLNEPQLKYRYILIKKIRKELKILISQI